MFDLGQFWMKYEIRNKDHKRLIAHTIEIQVQCSENPGRTRTTKIKSVGKIYADTWRSFILFFLNAILGSLTSVPILYPFISLFGHSLSSETIHFAFIEDVSSAGLVDWLRLPTSNILWILLLINIEVAMIGLHALTPSSGLKIPGQRFLAFWGCSRRWNSEKDTWKHRANLFKHRY